MYHSRRSRTSCSLAKSGSTSASGIAVEREVPRRVPRVLPLVGHRDDVVVVEVRPLVVAALESLGRRRRLGGIALEPAPDVVVVELLAPEQARERLAHDAPAVVVEGVGDDRGVERVRLAHAAREQGVELARPGSSPWGGALPSRSRTETVSPGRHASAGSARAALVPVALGVHAPRGGRGRRSRGTRPSRTGRRSVPPKRRSKFVSFSVNRSSGAPSTDEPAQAERLVVGLDHAGSPRARSRGRGLPGSHDHVLRNQSVGSRWQLGGLRPAIGHA